MKDCLDGDSQQESSSDSSEGSIAELVAITINEKETQSAGSALGTSMNKSTIEQACNNDLDSHGFRTQCNDSNSSNLFWNERDVTENVLRLSGTRIYEVASEEFYDERNGEELQYERHESAADTGEEYASPYFNLHSEEDDTFSHLRVVLRLLSLGDLEYQSQTMDCHRNKIKALHTGKRNISFFPAVPHCFLAAVNMWNDDDDTSTIFDGVSNSNCEDNEKDGPPETTDSATVEFCSSFVMASVQSIENPSPFFRLLLLGDEKEGKHGHFTLNPACMQCQRGKNFLRRLTSGILRNAFGIGSVSSTALYAGGKRAVCPPQTQYAPYVDAGIALLPSMALVNHSCHPNAAYIITRYRK